MGRGKLIKDGIKRVNKLNENFYFSFGKFKNKQIKKILLTPEGLNYCMWLCKKIETDYNNNYKSAQEYKNKIINSTDKEINPFIGGCFSKREVKKNRTYSALKYHLKKIKKYKKHLNPKIKLY